jgi:hypothetical protein
MVPLFFEILNSAKPYAFFPTSAIFVSNIGHFASSFGSDDDETFSKALQHPTAVEPPGCGGGVMIH